jgi:phage host-nuclease inhibitor protein Gam
MSQNPITVTYSLEEVLGQIQQQLVRMDARFDKVDEQFKAVHQEIAEIKTQMVKQDAELKQEMAEIKTQIVKQEVELKGEIKALGTELRGEVKNLRTEMQGIGKRLDTQEFINRSVVVSFLVAVLAGVVKLFLPQFIG